MDRRFFGGHAPEIQRPYSKGAATRDGAKGVGFVIGQRVQVKLDAKCNARWHKRNDHNMVGVIVSHLEGMPGGHNWGVRLPLADPETPHRLTSLCEAEMREVKGDNS